MSTHSNETTNAGPVVVVDPAGRWVAVQFDGQLGGYGPWHVVDRDGRVNKRFTLPTAGVQPALPDSVGGEAA